MKTQFKTLINACIFSMLTLTYFSVSAQSYYTPGQNYSLRNKIDATHAMKINIIYDTSGNATISKTIVSALSSDKYNSFIFCDVNRMNYNEESNCADFTEELLDFWVIDLETIVEDAVPLGGGKCFSCPCAKKLKGAIDAGTCDVLYIREGNTFNFSCEVAATCEECGKLEVSSGNGSNSTNQILIIQANSVQF